MSTASRSWSSPCSTPSAGKTAGTCACSSLARAAALSSSATTRLVNRLEDRQLLTRVLCADDRRGIYTELTPAGRELLGEAHPTHDRVLEQTLAEAAGIPELEALAATVTG
ncbi:DNA-binding MarR family transcriptional regulator [Kineosporia succinea]|uniref:DNA-binding MarR family transcriptional regulator n=1 Tax=Kineosporia succinea TaxID=84632 RepID=A0ABT9PEB1_9ACTN|nr:MarR family transcriptional regulator [Kineosporia succinea]MDP9831058.1 DNA-binding MarR family transcriptional regulator [Kineosporia succinea]